MAYKDEQLHEEKVFKDPVHRYVHVQDRVIWDLIATPEFQRLRRIKQLGTTYMTFHGAEHSRFNHSLGVYEIVRRIIYNFRGKRGWDPDERLLCLCAALLHDLGHGPFSHSFEKVFEVDHEEYTRQAILGDTDVHTILERVEKGFSQKVSDVIEKKYSDQLVVSLISSQIDADRMDYLQRDAYYTGVSYGHFDMERILRVMRPSKHHAVIKETGMHAVEDYIMSRYQMYWQVYFHPVTRSGEVILMKILQRAKYLYEHDYAFQLRPIHFLPFFAGDADVHAYLRLDEAIVMFYFEMWQAEEDPILSDLCSRFVNRNLFKFVGFQPEKQQSIWDGLYGLFQEAGIDPDYYLSVDSSSNLPYDFYRPGAEEERMPIYLRMPNGQLKELSTHSTIVDSISGKTRTDHKLYYPRDMVENLDDVNLQKKIWELLSAAQEEI